MIANEKLTVAIFISNPKGIYSGGRYFGLILAESLALLGHEVHYVTNRLPVFWDDFNGLDSHIDINVLFDWGKSIEKLPERLDLVIVVPGTSDNSFYDSAMCVAISRNARVCLLNFESENWFNSYAPEKRPASAWADWRKIASASNLIMSIAAEGTKYAQDYYTKVPKGCKFFHCYPPINTVAADSTEGVERGKRVILLARFSGDAHKGGDHIARIISQSLAGYSLSILVGTGVVPEKSKKEIEQLCGKYNINLDWRFKLSDVEKFKLYRQSEFLLFPSLFEGYGYPPIEARYCGCKVIAYDLPVLRETCGNDIVLVQHGNVDAFRQAIGRELNLGKKVNGYRLLETAPIKACMAQLSSILNEAMRTPADHSLYLSTHGRPIQANKSDSVLSGLDGKFIKLLQFVRKKITKQTGRITYFPMISCQEELTNHYHRAAWYLPKSSNVVQKVNLYVTRNGLVPSQAPSSMHECSENKHIKILRGRLSFLISLVFSDVVMLVDGECKSGWLSILKSIGIPIVNVDTNDVAAKEYGDYPGVLWRHLLSNSERNRILQKSYSNLTKLNEAVSAKGYQSAAVFGTGPSLEQAYEFDFSNTLSIICNSTVQNRKLMDHLQPLVITAGDVVSHFGVSVYAARFRKDLIATLAERDIYYVGTATFGTLLLYHYPELTEKMILIEQAHEGPNFNFIQNFSAPKLDSTMNIHMLPLAATFSNDIYILGCDGKAPVGDNEDFWPHAAGVQYHDLVNSGHLCHPVFDIHRQHATYDSHLDSVDSTLELGEKNFGKRYTSLGESHIPAFSSRYIKNKYLGEESVENKLPITIGEIADRLGPMEPLKYKNCDLKNLDSKISISSCLYTNGLLSVKGWFLTPHATSQVIFRYEDGRQEYLARRLKRPDVLRAYPEYSQEYCGIDFSDEVDRAPNQVEILLQLNGETLFSKVFPVSK